MNTDRREAIGDAAIGIVAREGLRSLTHRAVDRELGLPAGSTSYYARTRRQLIEAMVHRLANRTTADMPAPAAVPRTAPEAARTLAGLLDRLASRPDDNRARYALTVDLASDPELHGYLTHASPVRAGFLAAAAATLGAIGVTDPDRHAPALVALIDGLLFDRVAGSGVDPVSRPDAYEMILAYLTGLR
ncbi:MAG: TetR/AcrR family transcriptional regulator [Actinoplanes sp.]